MNVRRKLQCDWPPIAAKRQGFVLGRLILFIRRELLMRQIELELSNLDDRTLRDIGIDRSEITQVARRSITALNW
jgi:uncharacterized protein YjiS (DUF1127 family)